MMVAESMIQENRSRLVGELFQGAVYGLGISAAIWIPLNTKTLASPTLVFVGLLAAFAGATSRRLPSSWAWGLPAVLAADALFGLGAALLVAATGELFSRAFPLAIRTSSSIAFDIGRASLATVLASTVAGWMATTQTSAVIFAASWILVHRLLGTTRRRLASAEPASRSLPQQLPRLVLLAALTAVSGAAIAWLWQQPQLRVYLFALPALRAGAWIEAWIDLWREQRAAVRSHRTDDRLLRSLAESIAHRPTSPQQHLWRVEALATSIAELVGSTPREREAISQAALLHHAAELTLEDSAVSAHPQLVDDTLVRLGFPADVREILQQMHEHWDGGGPLGLEGEAIARGARILNAVDRYDQWLFADDAATPRAAFAMQQLQAACGSRVDPLMPELISEFNDRLQATGYDLSQPPKPERQQRAALLDADRTLQTIYELERIASLPLAARERWQLAAARCRTALQLHSIQLKSDTIEWRYGDRSTDDIRESREFQGEEFRVIWNWSDGAQPLDLASLERLAHPLGRIVADATPERQETVWTDPTTGLPNGDYLRTLLDRRLPGETQVVPGLGLIALQVTVPIQDDQLVQLARTLADQCDDRETLVRFGPTEFVLLTRESRSGQLVARAHALRSCEALESSVRTAHAAHPVDGDTIEELLATLDERLEAGRISDVVPFRDRIAAS